MSQQQFNPLSVVRQSLEPSDIRVEDSGDAMELFSALYAGDRNEVERGGVNADVHARAREIMQYNRDLASPDVGVMDKWRAVSTGSANWQDDWNLRRHRAMLEKENTDNGFSKKFLDSLEGISDYELAVAKAQREITGEGDSWMGALAKVRDDLEKGPTLSQRVEGALPGVTDPVTGEFGIGQFSSKPGFELGDVASPLLDAAVGTYASAASTMLAQFSKATGNAEAEQEFRDFARLVNEEQSRRMEESSNPLASEISQSVGGVGASVLAAALGPAAIAASVGGMALVGYGGASGQYNEGMRARGIEPRLWDEAVHGITGAIIEGVTERLGIEAIFRFAPGLSKKFVGNLSEGLLKEAAETSVEMGVGATTNAIEEALAEMANNAREKYGIPVLAEPTDPDRRILDGWLDSAEAGGYAGAALAALARQGRIRSWGSWNSPDGLKEFVAKEQERYYADQAKFIEEWRRKKTAGSITRPDEVAEVGEVETGEAVPIGSTVINLPSEPGFTGEQFTGALVDAEGNAIESDSMEKWANDNDADDAAKKAYATEVGQKAARAVIQASGRVPGRQEFLRKLRESKEQGRTLSREEAREMGFGSKTSATERDIARDMAIDILEALPPEGGTVGADAQQVVEGGIVGADAQPVSAAEVETAPAPVEKGPTVSAIEEAAESVPEVDVDAARKKAAAVDVSGPAPVTDAAEPERIEPQEFNEENVAKTFGIRKKAAEVSVKIARAMGLDLGRMKVTRAAPTGSDRLNQMAVEPTDDVSSEIRYHLASGKAVQVAVDRKMEARSGKDWVDWISRQPGIKAAEMAYFEAALSQVGEKISPQQLQELHAAATKPITQVYAQRLRSPSEYIAFAAQQATDELMEEGAPWIEMIGEDVAFLILDEAMRQLSAEDYINNRTKAEIAQDSIVAVLGREGFTEAQIDEVVAEGTDYFWALLRDNYDSDVLKTLSEPEPGQPASWAIPAVNVSDFDLDSYREVLIRVPESMGKFYETVHYPYVRNIALHIRAHIVETMDGKRFLFVEEIQSDWAQQRRTGIAEKGTTDSPFDTGQWAALGLHKAIQDAVDEGLDGIAIVGPSHIANRTNDNAGVVDFYDRGLPGALRKIASKSGAKTVPGAILSRANKPPVEATVVEFNGKMRSRYAEGFPLFQQAKAAVTFAENGDAVIHAMEQPDESSVIHELAHVARRQLLNRNIPQEQREGITGEDITVAEEWAGVKDGEWTVEAEEKFARGFEKYLYEGKLEESAPGVLGKVFDAAKRMLRKVYGEIKGSAIDVDISPAMERVYERLLTRAARNAAAKAPATKAVTFDRKAAEAKGLAINQTQKGRAVLTFEEKRVIVARNDDGTHDVYTSAFVNRQQQKTMIAEGLSVDEAMQVGSDALFQGKVVKSEGGFTYGDKIDSKKHPHRVFRRDWVIERMDEDKVSDNDREDPMVIQKYEDEYTEAVRKAAARGDVTAADARMLDPFTREVARGASKELDNALLEDAVADLERERQGEPKTDLPVAQIALDMAEAIQRYEPGSKAERKQWRDLNEMLSALHMARAQLLETARREQRSGKKGKASRELRAIENAIDALGRAFNRMYHGEDFGWTLEASIPKSVRKDGRNRDDGIAAVQNKPVPSDPMGYRTSMEYANTAAGTLDDAMATDTTNLMKDEIEAISRARGKEITAEVGRIAPSGEMSQYFGYAYWTDQDGNPIDTDILMRAWFNTRPAMGGTPMPSGFVMGTLGAAAVLIAIAGGPLSISAGMAAIPLISRKPLSSKKTSTKQKFRSKAYDNLRDEPKRRIGKLRRRPEQDRLAMMSEYTAGVWGVLTRPVRTLPNIKRWGVAREAFRLFKDVKNRAVDRASQDITTILAGLDGVDYETFNLVVLARNLIQSVDNNEPLRFGFAGREEVESFLIDLYSEMSPAVADALRRREIIIGERVDQMVALNLLPQEARDRSEWYMHQEVVKYAAINRKYGITGMERKTSPFQKGRIKRDTEKAESLGEEYDYLTDYVQSEVGWLIDAHVAIDRERVLAMMGQYDMYADLHKQAKDENRKRLTKGKEAQIDALESKLKTLKRGTKAYKDTRQQIIDLDPTYEFRGKRGQILMRLKDLANGGHIPAGPFNMRLLNGSNLSAEEMQQRTQMIQWIAGMKFSSDEKLNQAIGNAKKYLGTFGQEQSAIREALGRRFVTAETLAENLDGYTIWAPSPGNVFYKGWTLPDRLVEEIERKGLATLPKDVGGEDGVVVTKDDLRKVTIYAGKRKPMILPAEIASELERLNHDYSGSGAEQIAEMSSLIISRWKQWTLTNPFRVLSYNMRNITGDFDPMFWSAPGSFKYFKQAFTLANDYFYRNVTNDDIEAMLDYSLLSSSQISQEFPSVRETKELSRLFGTFNPKNPGHWWSKYFSIAGKATEWREHTSRIAAYLYYKDMLTSGKLKNYGASSKATVDALVESLGIEAAAAHMSRNLLGDYGNITVFGDTIRNHIIPFWSWQEINLRRTRRIVVNNFKAAFGGDAHALAGIATLPIRISVAALLYSRMLAFYAATHVWNFLAHGDDEERLSEYDRGGVHILLGTTEDGSIRIFRNVGAFGDLMQWVGLNDLVSLMPALTKGQLGVQDVLVEMGKSPVNKIVGGLNPFGKAAFESATGFTSFPDVFSPRRQDAYTSITGIFGLQDIGNSVRGMLFEDGSHARPNFWWRQFVGITDPRQVALSKIYNAKDRFLQMKGENTDNMFAKTPYTAMKRAVINGNYEAFLDAKRLYEESGRDFENVLQSISRSDPLTSLKTEWRPEFMEFLKGDDKLVLRDSREFVHDINAQMIGWWKRSESGGTALTQEIQSAKIGRLAHAIAKPRPTGRAEQIEWRQAATMAKYQLEMHGMSQERARRAYYQYLRENYTPETARQYMRRFGINWRAAPSSPY